MAKEMMIVFVYDTGTPEDEDADPADAVLYFHPGWVSDSQRHALCGQVVGATRCVGALLSPPTTVTLQSGKFILKYYGCYLLAIGSDRNIPDWVLSGRATLLTGLLSVYHGDLRTLATLFPDSRRLADKLYQILETYLPVLQFGCHIFQRVPMLPLPKSATSTFLQAMQVLEHCRQMPGALGGLIMYNNKIVATQLPPSLTSRLAVVEPHRVKSPAEAIATSTPLPLGAQLLLVYVPRAAHDKLVARSRVTRADAKHYMKIQETEKPAGGIKRDKSLLFTAVPEEDASLLSPPRVPDVVPFSSRPRPNKLSLHKAKHGSLDEESKENEPDNDDPFAGQTSVCSTPMVEYKRLHGAVLSICQNPDAKPDNPDVKPENPDSPPDLLSVRAKPDKAVENGNKDEIVLEMDTAARHYVQRPPALRKLGSVDDIQEAMRLLAATLRRSPTSPDTSRRTRTINDPSFPALRRDGVAVSEALYRDYIDTYQHQQQRDEAASADNTFAFNAKACEPHLDGFDSVRAPTPQRTPKKAANTGNAAKTNTCNAASSEPQRASGDQTRRKSLSLPLKSLSEGADGARRSVGGGGVQLTPLMEKLSHLAFSDKSSGYGSRVATPLDLPTPSHALPHKSAIDEPHSDSDGESSDCDDGRGEEHVPRRVRCALLVSGVHDMALLQLLQLDAVENADLINATWETALNALGDIERQCMEPPSATSAATDYSYLTLDPDWGTVTKGGPWPALDIATMGLAHAEFASDPALSELILRSEESVVLGAVCGGAEAFYAESGHRRPGPPAPSDPIAAVHMRAKRRLHRDHSIVIL